MRVLLTIRDPIAAAALGPRCAELLAQGHSVAVCYSASQQPSVHDALDAQRKVTLLLRQRLGSDAEGIPIFVVSGREHDTIEDCARAWGATEVEA